MGGLGVSDAMNEKELQIKNGQVCLLTGADYFAAKKSYEVEQRESYRQQWQMEAEQRIARIEAKKSPLERAGETGQMKTQKFAWSKDGQKSFEWRKIYHALVGGVGGMPEGGLATETLISPTELIAAIQAGADPSQMGGGGGGMQAAMLPVGVPMTYCRSTATSKERGTIKPTSDWSK